MEGVEGAVGDGSGGGPRVDGDGTVVGGGHLVGASLRRGRWDRHTLT